MWIVVSAFLAIGMGAVVGRWIFPSKQDFFTLLRRSLCLGFLVQLSFLFVARSLPLQMVISGFIALLGFYIFFFQWKKRSHSLRVGLFFTTVSSVYVFRILLEPIQQWDARSVWFFQGKILYYAQSLGNIWDWKNFLFGNFDYPKLHALLAAQSAQLAGMWNEYLPKFSLFLLLLPPLCFFAEKAKRNGFYLAFFIAALFVPGSLLWEGYMDGYFSLYALMAIYFFCQTAKTFHFERFLDGLLAAGVALSLKNEGLLLLVTCCVPTFGFWLFSFLFQKRRIEISEFSRRRAFALIVIIAFPFLFWSWEKFHYQIPSQMFYQPLTWQEIFSRISFSSFLEICKSAAFHGKVLPALGLLLASFPLGGWKFFRQESRTFQFLGFWVVLYFVGISYALYSNSMELYLPQHLYHVMDRLMLVVVQSCFVGILIFSEALGERSRAKST